MSCLYEAYVRVCMIVGSAAPGGPAGAAIGGLLSENEERPETPPTRQGWKPPSGFA